MITCWLSVSHFGGVIGWVWEPPGTNGVKKVLNQILPFKNIFWSWIPENCQHHNTPAGHCQWCVMETVSPIIDVCVLKTNLILQFILCNDEFSLRVVLVRRSPDSVPERPPWLIDWVKPWQMNTFLHLTFNIKGCLPSLLVTGSIQVSYPNGVPKCQLEW